MNPTTASTAVPCVREVSGHACPICDKFYPSPGGSGFHSQAVAGNCCAPRTCACGTTCEDRYYIACRACRKAADTEKWRNAPEVELGEARIYAEGFDKWYYDLDSYLEDLEYDGLTDEDARPYVCEFQVARTPDIGEILYDSGEMPDEWESGSEDWIGELQKQIEAAWEANKPGAWFPTKQRPLITR